MNQNFEQLGVFYLGRRVDADSGNPTDEPHLYQSRDLTTHGVCVGMTGSGKTGLCISLLEEAAIDGIPAIVIDPKGDMGNLLLSFPGLLPGDFLPWVDAEEAARKGMSTEKYAAGISETWRKGLEESGQSKERIAQLRKSADMCIYTPGSSAGRPLAVLNSFAAPSKELLDDEDLFQERIRGAVSGLLVLVGINADPIKSREFILLSRILDSAWRKGQDLSIMDFIQQIQSPPFAKVGVFNLDTFYPADERLSLAMTLNNLLVSPGFSAWLEGDPLDIQSLLFTDAGKPRISIVSIAHLSDRERMFFVTLLLNEVVSWMRSQPGTSSLRALLYMDEIFGFFPPTASPPSKQPMLTLLKQARAFGLGVVLSTQNPVDLDYKGLSNTGTWFLGRLQTERDRDRVLDGLESLSAAAGGGFDRKQLSRIISGLGKRMFLQHNVHEDGPVLFQTRWAMSFLRGPLTRSQIKMLTPQADQKPEEPECIIPQSAASEQGTARAVIDTRIDQVYVAPSRAVPEWARIVYRPGLLAVATLHYVRAGLKVDQWNELTFLCESAWDSAAPGWSDQSLCQAAVNLQDKPLPGAEFGALPEAWQDKDEHVLWKKQFAQYLYQERAMALFQCDALKRQSEPKESERDFRARIAQDARELRDMDVAKIRKKYADKISSLEGRILKAESRVEREADQYGHGKVQTVVAVGSALLSVFLGRTRGYGIGRAATAVRTASSAKRQKGDIARAKAEVKVLRQDAAELEAQCEAELAIVRQKYIPEALEVTSVTLPPRKSDIVIKAFALAWLPWFVDESGIAERAWR